ncbi:MAG: hypothetical protein E6J55_16620 [Deltaproteobacteria bacterium]|nr:MAG: hypothetical protein E6J55_16620 [Deltaproteobacteria bacterium]
MKPLKARVKGGRIVVDEPTDLPEGTEIELVPADAWDGLDDEERRRLHAALAASEEDVRSGRVRPASEVLADLKRARS